MSAFFQTVPGAIILLIVGFVLLVKGADAFVDGASSIAKILRVPSLIIGMTIVAMGTSLPETAVSVTASMSGRNALAISNAVGSNSFNLMMVIGVCAILTPVAVQQVVVKRDIPLSIAAAALLLLCGAVGWELGHLEGVLFLVCFAGFIFLMVRSALKSRADGGAESDEEKEADEMEVMSVPKSIVFIIIGAIAIKFGGDWVVESASTLALAVGMSETLVGLTIVAFGTSLPELVTSITAARKNDVDMALGNAIGSNIFNILMVLGIAATISPMAFLMENLIDIIILIAFSLIVWFMAWKKGKLERKEGIIMVALYAAYVVYICLR